MHCSAPGRDGVCLLVEGRGSRVNGRGSRVTSRGSRVNVRGLLPGGRSHEQWMRPWNIMVEL